MGDVTRFEDSSGVSYVRPHDLMVSYEAQHARAFTTTIEYIMPVSPSVRLMLQRTGRGEVMGAAIEAEIDKERYRTLALSEGQQVFLTPRRPRTFSAV